jgi:hypothetical protein
LIAFQYAHSETARQQVERLLSTLAPGSQPQRKPLPRLSVFRPEEDLPRLLPVAGSLPLSTATWEQIPAVEPQGLFGWVTSVAGQTIEFLQPGGSTSSRAAATAVELQFAL